MVTLRCPLCGFEFEYSWLEWVFVAPFHWFGKRKTKCPRCNATSWIGRSK